LLDVLNLVFRIFQVDCFYGYDTFRFLLDAVSISCLVTRRRMKGGKRTLCKLRQRTPYQYAQASRTTPQDRSGSNSSSILKSNAKTHHFRRPPVNRKAKKNIISILFSRLRRRTARTRSSRLMQNHVRPFQFYLFIYGAVAPSKFCPSVAPSLGQPSPPPPLSPNHYSFYLRAHCPLSLAN
jgi:hypothetical protein